MDSVSSQDAQLQSLKSQLEQATSAEQKAEIEKQMQDLIKVRYFFWIVNIRYKCTVSFVFRNTCT